MEDANLTKIEAGESKDVVENANIEAVDTKTLASLISALNYINKVENAKADRLADRLANRAKVEAWLFKIELWSMTESVAAEAAEAETCK